MTAHRKPLDASAIGLMLLLCFIWGFNQVATKLAADGVSMITQAAIRSAVATLLLLAWARLRGVPLLYRDSTLIAGILAGLLFAGEFAFIYSGLDHTDAARMVVFIFLAPCLTALGLTWFVPGERLNLRQWAGVLVAFGGIVLAFADGFSSARGTLRGDLYGLIAAILWAATTVLIRATKLAAISATRTLLYQLAVSAVVLAVVALARGEPGVTRLTPVIVASLFYQGVIVAFVSYLVWFWLLTRYLAARLSVFSFLTPLFGVAAAALALGEPISSAFLGAALLVGAGIYLVNQPGAPRSAD